MPRCPLPAPSQVCMAPVPCLDPAPCPDPAPCQTHPQAQEPLGHQIKHPKGFQGRRGFISGFPESVCHPTGERGPRPGHWQSAVMREDAPHLTEPHVPPGSACQGVPGHPWHPQCRGSRVSLWCCSLQRPSLGLEPPQLPGVLPFISGHQRSPGFPGHPVMHPGFLVHGRCPAAPPVPAVH